MTDRHAPRSDTQPGSTASRAAPTPGNCRSARLTFGRAAAGDGHRQRHARQLFRRRPASSTRRRPIEHALRLAAEGADILDIGGESTRPYAEPVDADERTAPRHAGDRGARGRAAGSHLDRHLEGRRRPRGRGRRRRDHQRRDRARRRSARCSTWRAKRKPPSCAMHMQGTPQTMQDNPTYDDVVEDSVRLPARPPRLRWWPRASIAERIALDPGIGFGKTHQHNLTLLAHCGRFHELGCPLLVGHSRKGFIGKVLGDKQADRTAGTDRRGARPGQPGRADPPRARRGGRPPGAAAVRGRRRRSMASEHDPRREWPIAPGSADRLRRGVRVLNRLAGCEIATLTAGRFSGILC